MEFMNAVELALRNYAQFTGRAGRKEFWYFILFQYSILFAFSLLGFTVFGQILVSLFSLFTLIPAAAPRYRPERPLASGRPGADFRLDPAGDLVLPAGRPRRKRIRLGI